MPALTSLLLASSNSGKLAEFQSLAETLSLDGRVNLALIPHIASLPPFEESAPTFGENGAGKASHYSRFVDLPVLADDSGLVIPALGGAPGVQSARYAGPDASDSGKIKKLLSEMRGKKSGERAARFVCVLAVAKRGRVLTVVSDFVEGTLLEAPRGTSGFGYDPIFYVPGLGKTFAELTREEKNRLSHRGKAFRKLLEAYSANPK
ncbi:MAG TPA: RdgB/HAM1 family non-canonical purine NTP pyrophosphatase [Candidatus Acidoferrales bacterium]|nr:RdgB/HAM1 family non-canonical purine NTP pyrophosphatase [Candidatus Acidoferrales bacterium]